MYHKISNKKSYIKSDKDMWKMIKKSESCWNWNGYLSKKGYGQIWIKKYRGKKIHRVIYELLVGKIPEGLTLDHLCRNRRCVNPKHLEPVSSLENISRAYKYRKSCN